MSRIGRSLLAPVLLLSTLTLAPAGQAGKPLSKQFIEGARSDATNLMAEVERLQEDIILDPATQKDRELYRLTETTLAELGRLEGALKSATSQEVLLKRFDEVDAQVRTLIARVRKTSPVGQTLQRATDHVNRANEELYFTLAAGDSKRAGAVTDRQARSFADATRDLERTARYALADSAADRAVMIDNTAKLAIAAERFEKTLHNKADLKTRQTDFGAVDQAWSRVVQNIGLLKPAENVHLLRSATRVDHLHERLYRLLDIKGKRPSLSIQS